MNRFLISYLTVFSIVCVKSLPTTKTGESHGFSYYENVICRNLSIPHGSHLPQTTPFPYTISPNVTQVRPLEKVNVTLAGINGVPFKGFLIQARHGDNVYGHFEGNNIEFINCFDKEKSTAGIIHSDRSDKVSKEVIWIAPAELPTYIEFTASIVKDFATFWVGEKSEKVFAITQ